MLNNLDKTADGADTGGKSALTVRDLIDTGIFTAMIFLICMLIMPIGFIPVLMPLYCVLIPMATGIPYMVFSVRTKHFGPVLIMSLLLGILLLVTGMGPWPLPVAAIGGLAAEFLRGRNGYGSVRWHCAGHAVFSIWCFGSFIPLIFTPDTWMQDNSEYGEEFIQGVKAVTQMWMTPVLISACVVFGWIGGNTGRRMLERHFSRAGIA